MVIQKSREYVNLAESFKWGFYKSDLEHTNLKLNRLENVIGKWEERPFALPLDNTVFECGLGIEKILKI